MAETSQYGLPVGVAGLDLPGQVLTAVQQSALIVEHSLWAKNTYRMRLDCPAMASQVLPGQFFMVRLPDLADPLLGRPFAMMDVADDASGQPRYVDFGYVVVGKMTSRLATKKVGETVEVWGPLGNGFPAFAGGHLTCVAGGIGQTPFLAVTKSCLGQRAYGVNDEQPDGNVSGRRVSLCYGVRSAESAAGVNDFEAAGASVHMATDDGSLGRKGFVTDVLQDLIERDRPTAIYCCGPEPMMRATSRVASEAGIDCWVSLESPMACGFGACFSCVCKVREADGSFDYKRVCVEGPVFRADQLVWE